MKNLLLLIGMLPFAVYAQDQGKGFKLTGKLVRLSYPVEWVYLQYRTGGDWKTDSVQPEKDHYSFSGKLEEPVLGRLRVKYLNKDQQKKIPLVMKRDLANVFIQPGRIRVISVDSFSNVQVRGSLAHTEYQKLVKAKKPYDDKMEPLYALYAHFNRSKETSAREKVEAVIDSLEKQMNEQVYGIFLRNYPSSPLAMYALQQYAGWDIDAAKVEPLFNSLSSANRNYPSALEFKSNLEIARKTGIGSMAMDFTQNDTLGNPVTLSSFKGRYLLLDFWASWCGPCRAENPNVVKVFNKYKDKGFHVMGVSLDRPGQKEKWLKAIHDDGLAWTQVSDLQFWNNEVARLYGIRAIPQNFLLDKEGRIIAKNIRGEELEKTVAESLEGSKSDKAGF